MTNNYKDLDSDNNAIDYMSKLEELNEEYSLVIAKKNQLIDDLLEINKTLSISSTAFNCGLGMMVVGVNNIIQAVNPAFIRITGYSEAEAVGQTPIQLNAGMHDKGFYTHILKSLNSEGYWEGSVSNLFKNGEIYDKYLSISSVYDIDGVMTHYVAMFVNVLKVLSDFTNLAFYDELTNLPNRRLFIDRINQVFVNCKRTNKKGALLFVDVDFFKNINDTLGHKVGDLCLKLVADRLVGSVRECDTVARYGGDEFVILIDNLSIDPLRASVEANQVVDKLVNRLSKPYSIGGQTHIITVSIGATLFNGEELDVNQIIGQADFAMFEAKKNGRNHHKFFDKNMRETVTIQGSSRIDFFIGIEKKQFRLFYQVQVDNNDNVFGAEALVRWMHPERSLLLPDKFISLLDEPCLGEWILNEACMQLNRWENSSLTRDLTLSVNISAKQFHQVNFVEQVKATVRKHCINPRLLILEFKECALVDNIEFVVASMNILKAFGIKFDLNNFGIGYSSLLYLTKLPLDHIKIDLSFVHNLTANNEDDLIVKTITAMAGSLGVSVIAEGVETETQKQILKNNGCQRYQGFLFGKPEPIAEFERVHFKADRL